MNTKLLFFITAEIALLLLVICLFLFFYIYRLRGLIARLEEKIVSLRKSLARVKSALEEAKSREVGPAEPASYLEYIDDEIELTRAYHQSLDPDRDIVLDLGPDTSMERQATALRYAFLVAEKEARYAGDEQSSDWETLRTKLEQLIQFYRDLESSTEVALSEPSAPATAQVVVDRGRIKQLEELVARLSQQWGEARKEAEQKRQQLLELGVDLGDEFHSTLSQYDQHYADFDSLLAEQSLSGTGGSGGPTHLNSASMEEMQRLRHQAIDQYRTIEELKAKLSTAVSEEEQQQALDALTSELEKQSRFLKEAETCTQLIEDELAQVVQENKDLKARLEATNEGIADGDVIDEEELERLEKLLADMTRESKDMLSTIATLEAENQSLKEGGVSVAADDDAEVAALQQKLSDMQQDLLNLQTQHIELEERYLELKMQ